MANRRRCNTATLATQAMELGFAVPQVVAHRLMRMAAAGPHPSPDDRNEFWLMGAEKIVAYGESCNAVLLELLRANWAFALSVGPQWWFRFPLAARSSGARTRRHVERTALAALAFCPICGTPVYACANVDEPPSYSLRVGCLKQRADLPPKKRIWCKSALVWAQDVSSIPAIDHQ